MDNQGAIAQKPINANLRLNLNQGDYLSTPRSCSTSIFGKILTQKKSILKKKEKEISKKSFHQKVENMKQKFTLILDSVNQLSNNRAQFFNLHSLWDKGEKIEITIFFD